MDGKLHEKGFKEYSFTTPTKCERPSENDCNWTLGSYFLHRSTNDETRFPEAEGVATDIYAKACSLFDIE